jgi:hypothetical protein
LEQQQHDREQLFDCDDEPQHGAANDAAAEHHGFRGDVNTAAVAARVDAVDAAAGSAKIPIVTRRQKKRPGALGAGTEPLEFRVNSRRGARGQPRTE